MFYLFCWIIMDGMQNRQTVLFSATQTPEVSRSFMLIVVKLFIHDFYRFLFLCIDVSHRLKNLLNCHLRKMKKVKKNLFMLESMMISQR